MGKITYLFGAGASAKALPMVKDIPDRLTQLIGEIGTSSMSLENNIYPNTLISNPKTQREYQNELLGDLEWLRIESAKHASIDTFAKKLFIQKKEKELKKLKVILSVFFIIEQSKNDLDFRYDAFFASILNDIHKLPENIRILSWNYDYQFEKAFSGFSEDYDLSKNQHSLNIKAKNQLNIFATGDITRFGIYKLNGTTGLYRDSGRRYMNFHSNLKESMTKDFLSSVVHSYASALYINDLHSLLSFAWEDEWSRNGVLPEAFDSIKDTVALVVIGYSFPFFNREIDKRIVGSMPFLKRVYFQAPDAEILKERFQALKDDFKGIELITRTDTSQFLLPNEL
jgi:hypothetical protein